MKAQIKIEVVEFHKDDSGFTWEPFSAEKLYDSEHEFNSLAQLEAKLLNIRECIFKDSLIFISPKSRKLRGFDAWKNKNRALLEIRH